MEATDLLVIGVGGAGRNALQAARLPSGVRAIEFACEGRHPSEETLGEAIANAAMAVIVVGLGGECGVRSAMAAAELVRSRGIPLCLFSVMPFYFEGTKRLRRAHHARAALEEMADTFVALSNQALFEICDARVRVSDALSVAWHVLNHHCECLLAARHGSAAHHWRTEAKRLSQSVQRPFAEVWRDIGVRTHDGSWTYSVKAASANSITLKNRKEAHPGTRLLTSAIGCGTGPHRAAECAEAALERLIFSDSLACCDQLIVNIFGAADITLFEIDEAMSNIRDNVSDEAEIFVSTSVGMEAHEDMRIHLRCLTAVR